MLVVPAVAVAAVALVAAGCGGGGGGGGSTTNNTTTQKSTFKAALVSDTAGFNDNGFNKNQLAGLNKAVQMIGGTAYPIVSRSKSDYKPNYTQAIRDGAKIIVGAGYLLDPTVKLFAKQYPNIDFAITDDTYKDAGGYKNVEGLTYATQEAGCLVGVLAAKEAQKMGGDTIGAVGGIKIPPVDSYIAGYKYCADKAVPGTKVLDYYSNSFDEEDKCATVAQNEMGQGATVIFQVAGLCGDGALKAASNAGKWGIGVDADEYGVAKNILTSAIKKTDVGVEDAVEGAANGTFKGGSDLLLNVKNNGVGVGRISPKVPQSWITLMNQYKAKIVAGTLVPPATLGK
jgi:basic membrane protein A and related proteins